MAPEMGDVTSHSFVLEATHGQMMEFVKVIKWFII